MKSLLLLLVLVGCSSVQRSTSEVIVGVDSVRPKESASLSKVYVTSGMEEVENNDLLFKKLSEMTLKSLSERGYVPVKDIKKSDLVVFLSYEVSNPENYTATRNVPIFNNPSFAVHNQNGQQIGTLRNTNFQPSGYTQVTTTVTVYNRKVTLHAYEASKAGTPEGMLWATSMNSNGPSADLIKVFPHLLIVGTPYFGEQLDSQVVKSIELEDPRASELRKPASLSK